MTAFRTLRADEIDCRVQTVVAPTDDKPGGCSLLLYKDARCDMNILDETVGPERWQRSHSRDNANCTVSIYFPEIGWVAKEDTGTESNTEKEKGLCSDSFKRACVCWGIGRELYTAPDLIWVNGSDIEWRKDRNGKMVPKSKFVVADIKYDEYRRISALTIALTNGKAVYTFKAPKPKDKPEKPEKTVSTSAERRKEIQQRLNEDPAKAEMPEVHCPYCGEVVTAQTNKKTGELIPPSVVIQYLAGHCPKCRPKKEKPNEGADS
jgi:hypothetical protein